MTSVAESAVWRNAHAGHDLRSAHRSDHAEPALSRGGAVIYQLTRRAPATCNAMAELAGIGCEVAK